MSPRSLSRISILFLVLALAAALAFAACKEDKKKTGTTPAASPTAAAIDISGVPELADGKMTIGSDIAYPPIESLEEGTHKQVGMDIDLAKAMAGVLGVEVEFQQVGSFEGIVGDLVAKRYDIVMSAISITTDREKKIDFVPYFGPVGTGVLVKKGNPDNIKGLADLCGRAAAAQNGTYQVDQMKAANSDICKNNPIDIKAFPDNPTAVQEVTLGRVAAELADDPVAAYSAAQSSGALVEVVATKIEAAPYGIGVRKDSPGLKSALEQALSAIRANGTYDQILTKWNQEQFALK